MCDSPRERFLDAMRIVEQNIGVAQRLLYNAAVLLDDMEHNAADAIQMESYISKESAKRLLDSVRFNYSNQNVPNDIIDTLKRIIAKDKVLKSTLDQVKL